MKIFYDQRLQDRDLQVALFMSMCASRIRNVVSLHFTWITIMSYNHELNNRKILKAIQFSECATWTVAWRGKRKKKEKKRKFSKHPSLFQFILSKYSHMNPNISPILPELLHIFFSVLLTGEAWVRRCWKRKESDITVVGVPIRRRPYQSSTNVVAGGGDDADHGTDGVGDKCFGLLNY